MTSRADSSTDWNILAVTCKRNLVLQLNLEVDTRGEKAHTEHCEYYELLLISCVLKSEEVQVFFGWVQLLLRDAGALPLQHLSWWHLPRH